MASGIPSSRVTNRATNGRVPPVRAKCGSAWRARSANSITASDGSLSTVRPGAGRVSGASRYRVSPATRSSSRLVASTRISSQAVSSPAHSCAAAPITCSQLSSTSSSCRRASPCISASAAATPGCSGIPSAAATTAGTCTGSRTTDNSASHAPSANRPATCLATSPASRVLPAPPGPVTVTSRLRSSKAATSLTDPARPTKLVNAGTKPCTPPADPSDSPRACLRLAASTCAAWMRPRAAATNNDRTGSARPSAPASSTAVSLRAVRLIPRSRSLTDRGLKPAASASSSCVSRASARNCRSTPPNPDAGCPAISGVPSAAPHPPAAIRYRPKSPIPRLSRPRPPHHSCSPATGSTRPPPESPPRTRRYDSGPGAGSSRSPSPMSPGEPRPQARSCGSPVGRMCGHHTGHQARWNQPTARASGHAGADLDEGN